MYFTGWLLKFKVKTPFFSLSQYETGKHTHDYSTLKRIAKILDVPIAFCYAEDDKVAQAIKIFGKLNSNKSRKILSMLQEALAGKI